MHVFSKPRVYSSFTTQVFTQHKFDEIKQVHCYKNSPWLHFNLLPKGECLKNKILKMSHIAKNMLFPQRWDLFLPKLTYI